MKVNKKVIEIAAVTMFALAITFSTMWNKDVHTEAEQYTEDMTEIVAEQEATKERTEVALVAAAEKKEIADVQPETIVMPVEEVQPEAMTEETEEVAEEPEEIVEEPVSEWDSRLMPKVEEYLNIRKEGNEEAEVVGKLHKGAMAEILEQGEEWTKISSGSVEGYVSNEYCVFGAEAEAMAKEQGTLCATALVDGLRVREEASATEETGILDVLKAEDTIKVDTDAQAPEGWVAVVCSDQTAYVSAEYVSVELKLGKAISIEEELAAIRKAEEEKAAREAAARAKNRVSQKAAVAATYDELTLLGALIQCEAGGECYEGQVAVGAVVMNRIRSGFASSIIDVIYQSGQFTPVASGALANRLSRGVSSSCMQAAQEAINGLDNVGGAVFFRRVSSGYSGIVIGNHVFFN